MSTIAEIRELKDILGGRVNLTLQQHPDEEDELAHGYDHKKQIELYTTYIAHDRLGGKLTLRVYETDDMRSGLAVKAYYSLPIKFKIDYLDRFGSIIDITTGKMRMIEHEFIIEASMPGRRSHGAYHRVVFKILSE